MKTTRREFMRLLAAGALVAAAGVVVPNAVVESGPLKSNLKISPELLLDCGDDFIEGYIRAAVKREAIRLDRAIMQSGGREIIYEYPGVNGARVIINAR